MLSIVAKCDAVEIAAAISSFSVSAEAEKGSRKPRTIKASYQICPGRAGLVNPDELDEATLRVGAKIEANPR